MSKVQKKKKKKRGKFYSSLQMKYSNVTVQINVTRSAVLYCLYCGTNFFSDSLYCTLPDLTVTDVHVLTTSPVVIFRVKVSCITSVDGVNSGY